MKAFTPRPVGTKPITTTATSQRVLLSSAPGTIDVLVTCNDTSPVFIEFGDVTVTAVATTGIPIMPGSAQVFQVRSAGQLYVAAIGTANSRITYFTPGQGI